MSTEKLRTLELLTTIVFRYAAVFLINQLILTRVWSGMFIRRTVRVEHCEKAGI